MNPTIRFAGPADAELILHFIRGLAEYEHEPGAVAATPALIRSQMEQPDPPFECLIAEHDGAPAGFALFFVTTAPGAVARDCIWRTSSCRCAFAAVAWAGRCSSAWRNW
jgi:hypothetical protein